MEFWIRYALALLALAAMLGGLAVLGRALRRVRLGPRARRIQVVESVMLAPQTALHVVRVDSRELLLATGEVTKLAQLGETTRT